jgi:hypothetical protein
MVDGTFQTLICYVNISILTFNEEHKRNKKKSGLDLWVHVKIIHSFVSPFPNHLPIEPPELHMAGV